MYKSGLVLAEKNNYVIFNPQILRYPKVGIVLSEIY